MYFKGQKHPEISKNETINDHWNKRKRNSRSLKVLKQNVGILETDYL